VSSGHRTAAILLRLLALVGLATTLLSELAAQAATPGLLLPRQWYGFVLFVIVTAAVGLTLLTFLPRPAARVLTNIDLLVPYGLLLLAQTVLEGLAKLPGVAAVLTSSKVLQGAGLTFTLSIHFFLGLFLNLVFAAWTTTLVVELVRVGRPDLPGGFKRLWGWLGRVTVLETIGWAVPFALVALAVTVSAGLLPLAIILLGGGAGVWNLLTAAVLPAAFDDRVGFFDGCRQAFLRSFAHWYRWAAPVLAQLVLLGFFTFIHLSYSDSPRPGQTTTHTQTNWSVNAFWVGGYDNDCRWYGKLMEAAKAPTVPVVSTLLGVVFMVLALAVKVHVAGVLWAKGPDPEPGPTDLLSTSPDRLS
jgi:hypothetical protein